MPTEKPFLPNAQRLHIHAQYICKKDLQGCERTGFTAVSAGNCTIMAPKYGSDGSSTCTFALIKTFNQMSKALHFTRITLYGQDVHLCIARNRFCTAVSAGKATVQRPATDPPLVVRQSFGVVHSCSGGARVGFPELFQIEVSPWQRNQLTPIV